MDRTRAMHGRQKSISGTPNSTGSPSPMSASPVPRHTRFGSSSGLSNVKRPQNTKAAAQRLAKVMAHQPADDDDDEEDDLLYDYDSAIPSVGLGLAGGRKTGSTPMSVRTPVEQPPSARSIASARSSTVSSVDQQPLSASILRPSQSTDSAEETHTPSDRLPTSGRSPSYIIHKEQPPSYIIHKEQPPSSASFASANRSSLRVKTVAMVPPAVPLSIKPAVSTIPAETPPDKSRDKRLSFDFGTFKYKEPSDQQSSSALQDELDMLQEENDSLVEKLRMSEERCEEAEARTRQLEKQIASLGDGVSLEARLLSRKEAELQKREAALKVASQTYGGSNEEIAALRMEAEAARDEATSALEQLHDVECEVKSLRTMTQRMILTREEMEEIVLKRCWLARYWSLCLHLGIHGGIAAARYEYWSSLVSRPIEVILAAGRKAKDDNSFINNDLEEREKVMWDENEISRKAHVESMLLVEKGLRELTSLKVEEAVAISFALKRRPTVVKSNMADELKVPIEGQNFSETFELSQEESEDVLVKQVRTW
ncbi:hypothetical protein ACJIZ3_010531 [Penstemon smallii]|uniref:Coiled-coil domain-containing protein SCD2 n=1 Tax=Penstemon smallii TaxID=265156 RepID=A0ABD3UGL0_9LAMI